MPEIIYAVRTKCHGWWFWLAQGVVMAAETITEVVDMEVFISPLYVVLTTSTTDTWILPRVCITHYKSPL